ncbi:phage tail tape measure protein [Burkholderia orbicola]|uniref:phage tail tape measure protein n=1 Tax=Burkholderia orbicola TaxID=2978683 RepID=UPI00265465CF|nr:phage tail tape measure protein [Burkholderia orbicola]MDN7993088.1 phage tail tape measure protein [Burkholderia orbicola]
MSNESVTRVTVDATGYTAGLDRAKRSAESFAASQEAVSKRMKAAQEAIAEAATNGSKASASAINSFVQSTMRMADTVGKTRSQLLEMKAAQLGVSDSMASYIAQVKAAENAHHGLNFATAGARREMLVLAHEASQGNWKRFAGSLMVLGERTDAMSLIMNKSVLSVGAMVGVVAMAAGATYKAAEAMGAYGEEIDKIAKRSGASTDTVQQWMFAAKASGVDAKEAVKSFSDLGEAQNKAIHGNKDAAAAFTAIGISLKDLKSSTPNDLLPRIADAFQQSADGASKAAVANEIFGASGDSLIPILDRGSAGLRELSAAARDAGGVIGNQTVMQMKAFEEHMNLSRAQMDAMSMSAKTKLLPTIMALTDAMGSNAAMKPIMEDFYQGVGVVMKSAASAGMMLVAMFEETSTAIATAVNVIHFASVGAFAEAGLAAKVGYNDLMHQGKGYADFLNKLWSDAPKEMAGPPRAAMHQRTIDFAKGEHQHQPKAYHDDAATRFLQQLRDQDAATRAALTTNDKLTEAEKQQAEFLQKMADLKERKILTVDEKSLVAAQDRIKAQFAINVEHERELKLKQDIQKLDERAAQVRAQIGNYQRGQGEQHQRQLDAFGMGSEALAQVQAMKSIYSEYERMQWQLEKETPKSARGSQQYLAAQADIKAGLNQSLQDFDNYYAALKAKQDDWANGAATAFANYVDSAHNAAAQAQEAVTRTIKGMEDSMVEFVTTGRVSFTKLADGILADLTRMATRGLMSKFVENSSSMGGQLAGGLFAAHPDVAAKAANMLPGDPLESLMKLTKGFGTMGAQILPKAIGPMGAAATQNMAALNAANATVATMTVGTLIGGFGAGSGGGIGGLGGLLGGLGQGDMAGAFGFTATGVTGSTDAVVAGAMSDSSVSGMSALFGLGGALAGGGPADGGTPYLVGEKGPELFVPKQSGRVVPNHELRTGTADRAPSVAGSIQNNYMNITVPAGTTRATAQQQGRAIMESAAIAQRRNG